VSMWRKTVVATAIVGAGLAATTGSAFAGENDHDHDRSSSKSHEDKGGHDRHDGDSTKHSKDHDGDRDRDRKGGGDDCGSDVKTDDDTPTSQTGLVNVADTDTIVPTSLCQNNVPLNALGVQVPIQDLGLNLPILSPSDDNGGNASEVS
jgi:hypothetical protein